MKHLHASVYLLHLVYIVAMYELVDFVYLCPLGLHDSVILPNLQNGCIRYYNDSNALKTHITVETPAKFLGDWKSFIGN